LTDAVKRKPYSVILFDDADKAHPKVLSLILEILDSGFVTDATGKKVSFKNTVVVISTNLGNDEISEKDLGFNSLGEKDKIVEKNKNEKENFNHRIGRFCCNCSYILLNSEKRVQSHSRISWIRQPLIFIKNRIK